MRWNIVVGNLGSIAKLFGFSFFIPIIPAFWYRDAPIGFGFFHMDILVFLFMAVFTVTLGHFMQYMGKTEDFHRNEAVVIVSLAWLFLAGLAAVPFIILGALASPVDAFFEAMSGMTTTGATVMPFPLEQHFKSILLWRGLLQWLGGMGIIVLSVAILSQLTSGGLSLLEAESPGPSITRLKPKIMETAKILWTIYIVITASEIIILSLAGLDPYDAVYHSFTTMATGGFSPHTNSIAYFPPLVHWIVIFFMIMAGTNFALYYQVSKGNTKRLFSNSEYKAYLTILGFVSAAVAVILFREGMPVEQGIRQSLFHVVSIMTTTGFAIDNYDQWPDTIRLILLFLMFVGGSAGSTSGSMKVLRIVLVLKMTKRKFIEALNPRRMVVVRLGGKVISEDTLSTVSMFFISYLLIFVVGSLIMTALGLDMVSAVAATASALGNVGPGLGMIGPANNFRSVPEFGRFVLAILMWIGRLEVFTAVVLFNPALYEKKPFTSILKFPKHPFIKR